MIKKLSVVLILFGAFVGTATYLTEQYMDSSSFASYHHYIHIFAGCLISAVACLCYYLLDRNSKIYSDFEFNSILLNSISEISPIGFGVGEGGRCRYANEILCCMTGYEQDELLGIEVGRLCPDEDVLKEVGEFRDNSKPGDVRSLETRLLCKDGSVKYILFKLIFPESRKWRGKSVFAVMDITERKRMEDELVRSLQELERRKDAYKEAHRLEQQVILEKNSFQANMCHEIRTPLNGMQGMLQILQENLQREENLEVVQLALGSCRRLSNLLNDVLHVSRLEAGKDVVMNNPFDVCSVLEEVGELFRPAAEQSGLSFDIEIGKSIPHIFIGDNRKLVQILNNLAGNAVKFTSKGGVRITADFIPQSQGRGRLLFTIADTGIGISDDDLERIFNSYSQVDGSITRKYEGAGLGLTIVKRLILAMGGGLAVVSEPDKGTTMYLSLGFRVPSPGIDY
ncbi:ATP-binding protein [Desulfovibrio sp. JC010]|uniref:PAS domain-containing sensor histidine kinase n=1 Tax=Desulfovibrio sp. JC010 TaxID=2593641 RepID=UPI0013D63983|nr:ATP-binding protein [Desulfovibrio sp. JC010]NDV28195.1 PAS domain S-box protein [Desulfovibrio sp. JC010]